MGWRGSEADSATATTTWSGSVRPAAGGPGERPWAQARGLPRVARSLPAGSSRRLRAEPPSPMTPDPPRRDEIHGKEQFFFDDATVARLADVAGEFERPCALCAPLNDVGFTIRMGLLDFLPTKL